MMKKLFAALLAVVFVLGSSVAYGATTHYPVLLTMAPISEKMERPIVMPMDIGLPELSLAYIHYSDTLNAEDFVEWMDENGEIFVWKGISFTGDAENDATTTALTIASLSETYYNLFAYVDVEKEAIMIYCPSNQEISGDGMVSVYKDMDEFIAACVLLDNE